MAKSRTTSERKTILVGLVRIADSAQKGGAGRGDREDLGLAVERDSVLHTLPLPYATDSVMREF